MNIRSAYSFRTINVAGAIIAAAMIAAACGSDDDTTVAPVTAAETTTTAPETDGTVPIRGEHTCDLGEGQIEGAYCLVDGQWWFDAGAGFWVESDGPTPTTTTVAEPPVPSLAVEPVEVEEGPNTFTLEGTGFDPGTLVGTVICDTPSVAGAVIDSEAMPDEYCDLESLEVHQVDEVGNFTSERDVVVSDDVLWVVGDATDPLAFAPVDVVPASETDDEQTTPSVPTVSDVVPEPEPEPAPTQETAPEPEPEPDTVLPPPDDWHCVTTEHGTEVCSPTDDYECVETAEGRVCGEKEPVATPEPEPDPAPDVLSRCTEGYGSGRVRTLTGTTVGGTYSFVAAGDDDACELIQSWFPQALQAERERATDGSYPCEYVAPDDLWDTNVATDPAILVGCWPTLLPTPTNRELLAEADGDVSWVQGHTALPPNNLAMVEALWDCYHEALTGPPEGSQQINQWPTVLSCNRDLESFGNPIRQLGVRPACAAESYKAQVDEFKQRGTSVVETITRADGSSVAVYAGAYSWANCSTRADLLTGIYPDLPASASFSERCSAAVEGASHDIGGDPEWAAQIEGAFCDGPEGQRSAHLIEAADRFGWPLADDGANLGAWILSWLTPEGSVCFERAFMNAAANAVNGQATKVAFC